MGRICFLVCLDIICVIIISIFFCYLYVDVGLRLVYISSLYIGNSLRFSFSHWFVLKMSCCCIVGRFCVLGGRAVGILAPMYPGCYVIR